jgi:glycosyltransferase involved in cell wall biosynthesis
MDRSKLAIIIPAFNEEKTVSIVVNKVKPFGIVIVVNDASTDNTAAIAEKAGAVVVSHSQNKGYDGALNAGFLKANELGCSYAITFDADGQHEASIISDFIELFERKVDLVLGMRPKLARISEHVFYYYTRLAFGIRDPLCGMKGYNLAIYRERGWFDSYGSIGTELALWAIKNKYKYEQLAVPIFPRIGTPRFGRVFKANMKIFKALINSIIRL